MSSSDNIITIILLAAVAYVLYTMGLLTPKAKTSSAVTPECPRGEIYDRFLFTGCDPNYRTGGWLGETCECQHAANKAAQQNISGTAQEASHDRQATTNKNVPAIASPVIPDSSPMSPSSSSWIDAGTSVLTQLADLGKWMANPLGWKL